MPSIKNTAIRLYRRYFGSPTAAMDHEAGITTILSGNAAVAIAEATISQTATLGSPGRALWGFDTAADSNTFGQPVSTLEAESARGAMSAAIGLSLAGRRATTFLTGQEIATAQDLLYTASGRHLPLVIHLSNNALALHGIPSGTGHEGFNLSIDSGCFTLFAANAQEALDFTYIARRVAEQCLVPGIVAMDAEQTAGAYQNVHLLAPSQIQVYLGPAEDSILVPSVAQRLLFGRTRRRVPRWHDVDRPVLQGAAFDRETYALGALGKPAFFDEQLPQALAESFEYFGTLTGRRYRQIMEYRIKDAGLVFVAQGSAVETARAAADQMRSSRQAKAGVLGISALRPLPSDEIKEALGGTKSVVVLDRCIAAPGSTGPLARELTAALSGTKRLPICHNITYGIGGAPLRITDLLAVPDNLSPTTPTHFALGASFTSPGDNHPKREILLDSLQRAYPELGTTGIRAPAGIEPPRTSDTLTITFVGEAGDKLDAVIRTTSQLLLQLEGGFLRTRQAHEDIRWYEGSAGQVFHGAEEAFDPGDELPADVLVLTDPTRVALGRLARGVRTSGVVLVVGPCHLEHPFIDSIESKGVKLFQADVDPSAESIVGATFGALISAGLSNQTDRRITGALQATLRSIEPGEREQLIELFASAMAACATTSVTQLRQRAVRPSPWDGETPRTARVEGRDDNEFDSLPRFWDQEGVFFHNHETDLLSIDPYFASGTMAPLSSTFRNLTDARTTLPVLDPDACTGCGKCWTACPDSAVGAVTLSPASLIETGMRAAPGAEAARQITNQLGARIATQARKGEIASTAGAVIRAEFDWVKDKMALTAEREEVLGSAIDKIAASLENLPLILTEPFFNNAEKISKDSGEFLSLAINPDACKGCGICVEVCEPLALSVIEQDSDRIARVRKGWHTWATTPDTPASTIERVIGDGSLPALPALNLSRYCLHAMAGGDSAEPGSGEKIALRMVLAAAEFHQQPLLNRFAHDTRERLQEVVARIQSILSSTMPAEDLDTLRSILEAIDTPKTTLTTLAREIDQAVKGRNIDTTELRQLAFVAEQLEELAERIAHGNQGLGRARFGLALTPGSVSRWAGEFPYNSFHSPVVIDITGETAQMAAGLLEGHLRDTCDSVTTLRRATVEIERPSGIQFERDALANLRWRDLTADERRLCPPLLLVGGDDIIAGAELSQVLWLLCTELPIKIIAFADMDLGLTGENSVTRHHDPRINLGLVSLTARSAFIAQSSIANIEHLHDAVSSALNYPGPALIRVYTPSPLRHGIAQQNTSADARLAYESRAIPLFTYDPRIDGVHGKRISLNGNPASDVDWMTLEDGKTLTPADWAIRQNRFAHHFSPARDAEGTLVNVSEFLREDRSTRSNKTPVVELGEETYAISSDLINVVEEMHASWQVLQELSGLVTPFTEAVETRVREDVAEDQERALAALRAEYEQQLAELTVNVQQDVATKIRGQLATLVKMAPVRARAETDVPDD